MRSVIFDLDGTLADTSGDLIAAANACFRDLGHGDLLDPAHDQGTALRGGRAMLTLGFDRVGSGSTAEIDQQYPLLLQHYASAIDHYTVLYPGAIEAVHGLRAAGYKVGICTNKPEALAEQLMTNLGVRAAFDALIGADTLPVKKPDPEPLRETARRAGGDPDQMLLVGDSITDHSTARAAGVPSVLVSFGPSGDDMSALKPDALLHDYSDLRGIVQALIG